MKKYRCAVKTDVIFESKTMIVYAENEEQAREKVLSHGYQFTLLDTFTDYTDRLDSFIDSQERDGDFLVLR